MEGRRALVLQMHSASLHSALKSNPAMKWETKIKPIVPNDKDMNDKREKITFKPSRKAMCYETMVTRRSILTCFSC